MIDPETLDWLSSPEGHAVLRELAGQKLDGAQRLPLLTRLRKRLSRERAAAALELALLRQRARTKFTRADAMFFTREALEQATGEDVARHRAARFRGSRVALDLGCGIGGDTLALAEVAEVVAFDCDPLRLQMARLNAAAYAVADRIHFVCADYTTTPLPPADAAFVDPARRVAGERVFSIWDYTPPLTVLNDLLERYPKIAAKVSPGVKFDELARIGLEPEVEIVSVRDECKEATLWGGDFRQVARRATLLPSDAQLTDRDPVAPIPLRPPGRYLFEPDCAIIRAHLVATLATKLGLAQIDRQIAYLTGDDLPTTPIAPYATGYHVLEALPFNLKALNRRLRAAGVGRVTIKKRGSPIEPEAFQRQLALTGDAERVIVLTRVQDHPYALICQPLGSSV